MEVFEYNKHLAYMMDKEILYATNLNDHKMILAAKDNFSKILTTIAVGCYSNVEEIAKYSLKTLMQMSSSLLTKTES